MAKKEELVFLPLGGVGEIGMNLALYGYGTPSNRQWIMVDCGVTFPGPDLPGVDPASPSFTWDDMIKAAVGQGKTVAEQGARYEGYMVWINALVLSGGGQILSDAEAGRNASPSMAGEAGDKAAEIIGNLARSAAAPADLSTAQEEQSRATFQGARGMFMLNWP